VAGEHLSEGLEVVIGLQPQASAKPDTSNPFAPSFRRGAASTGSGRPR
jgi:hypothetical protein